MLQRSGEEQSPRIGDHPVAPGTGVARRNTSGFRWHAHPWECWQLLWRTRPHSQNVFQKVPLTAAGRIA
jgi:hypothetical protein